MIWGALVECSINATTSATTVATNDVEPEKKETCTVHNGAHDWIQNAEKEQEKERTRKRERERKTRENTRDKIMKQNGYNA